MFDRYTEAARRAMFFARYAVTRRGGDAIEPEHLLLGLLRGATFDDPELQDAGEPERTTTAATLLESAAVTRVWVEGRMPPRTLRLPTDVEIPFSASARRCLDDAMREANQMEAAPMSTGHLLLGLLQADGTEAATLLHAAGLRINDVRARVEADIAAGVEGEPPPNSFSVERV